MKISREELEQQYKGYKFCIDQVKEWIRKSNYYGSYNEDRIFDLIITDIGIQWKTWDSDDYYTHIVPMDFILDSEEWELQKKIKEEEELKRKLEKREIIEKDLLKRLLEKYIDNKDADIDINYIQDCLINLKFN
jgi:hypothetical protein